MTEKKIRMSMQLILLLILVELAAVVVPIMRLLHGDDEGEFVEGREMDMMSGGDGRRHQIMSTTRG